MKPANEKLFYYALLIYSFGILASILMPGTFDRSRAPSSTAAGAIDPPVIAAACAKKGATTERGTNPSDPIASIAQEILTELCILPIERAVPMEPSADAPGAPVTKDDVTEQLL